MIVSNGRLLKESSNRKSKLVLWLLSMLVTRLSNMAIYLLLIWLQTLVVTYSESCQTSFPSFCAVPFEVAVLSVLFIWIWADALSYDRSSISIWCFVQDSIWNMLFCSYLYLYSEINEPGSDWLKDWWKWWALPWLATSSSIPLKNCISQLKKKVTRSCPIST